MTEYAERDIIAQGEHYLRHVSAMTSEGLHAKSAIAAELAHRDIEIESLKAQLIELQLTLIEVATTIENDDSGATRISG